MPQIRPDRNGKLVTRHVLDDSLTKTASSKLPAPSLTGSIEEPQKTVKEMETEMREALAQRFWEPQDNPTSAYKRGLAGLSWLKLNALEVISDTIDNKPAYQTVLAYEEQVKHALNKGEVFPLIMQANIHDIGNSLVEAGFTETSHPRTILKNHFPNSRNSYVSEEQIKDFRVLYLSSELGFSEQDHAKGSMSYYRALNEMKEEIDDVIKVLPILRSIIDDDDNYYLLEEGIEKVLEISRHASKYSTEAISRISDFVKGRENSDYYDTEVIDEMLANTTPSMTTGWL